MAAQHDLRDQFVDPLDPEAGVVAGMRRAASHSRLRATVESIARLAAVDITRGNAARAERRGYR